MRARRLLAAVSALAALAVAPAAYAAVDAFIWFEDGSIKGESRDPQHQNWIEVESFQLQEVNRQAASYSGGQYKPQFSDVTVKRVVDKVSPALFKAYSSGKHYGKVAIEMRKAGGGPQDYLKITLEDVFLASYQVSGGGAQATETIKLKFIRSKMEYTGPTKPATTAHIAAPAASNLAPAATPTPRKGVVSAPVVH